SEKSRVSDSGSGQFCANAGAALRANRAAQADARRRANSDIGSCRSVGGRRLDRVRRTGYSNRMRLSMRVAAVLMAACTPAPESSLAQPDVPRTVPDNPNEPHLTNVRMLTNGGENAEAYFSADGQRLIFQATRPGISACDQIFTMNADGTDVRMVSSGEGATTCARSEERRVGKYGCRDD